jgi:hypothetical protein
MGEKFAKKALAVIWDLLVTVYGKKRFNARHKAWGAFGRKSADP